MFRHFEFNDYAGINKIISIVDENKASLDVRMLQIRKLEKLQAEIASLQKQFTDYHVKGENIIHFLIQMAAINNQLVQEFPEKKLKKVAIWFGCASGENRTGIVYYHNICASIVDYFSDIKDEKLGEEDRIQIYNMIAQSQHIHVMTGYQGNTFGTDGIRSKSSSSLKNYHSKSLLTETSDVKEIPAHDAFYDELLERLDKAIESNETDVNLKAFIFLARQYLQYAKNEQENILFFPDEIKNLYTNITHVLEKIIITSLKATIFLSELLKLQESLKSVSNINDSDLKIKLALLTPLLIKIIDETENIIKSAPSEQLAVHGLFKVETKGFTPQSLISPSRSSDDSPLNAELLQPVQAVKPYQF